MNFSLKTHQLLDLTQSLSEAGAEAHGAVPSGCVSRRWRSGGALLSLVCAFGLAGCAGVEMYHQEHPVETIVTPKKDHVSLGFVEVDDMGDLQDFHQLTAVTEQIKKESQGADKGLRVLVFVHGWNNNASPEDGKYDPDDPQQPKKSLGCFKKLLADLQDTQGASNGGKVFGIFIGWRGRTLKSGSVKVDFYHRYSGGHRAGLGSGTDAIFEVAAAAKQANNHNVVILCGHSFGGLFLEDAISQPARARLAQIHATNATTIQSSEIIPADLVVLLNEAEKADQAYKLVSALRDRKIWTADKDLPWIVSVTGHADQATGTAFPTGVTAGRWVFPFNLFNTSVSGKYRTEDLPDNAGSQRVASKTTVGHYTPLFSHEMKLLPDEPNRIANVKLGPKTNLQQLNILSNLHPRRADGSIVFHCEKGSYMIRRVQTPNAFNMTPYWIMEAPPEIIADHGDIWNDRVAGLITAFIHLRSAEAVTKTPAVKRAPASAPAAPQGRVTLKLKSL